VIRWGFIKVWLKDQLFVFVQKSKMITDRWMLFFTTLSFFVVVYDFGFYTTPSWKIFTNVFFPSIIFIFFLAYLLRIIFFIQQKTRNWRRYADYLILIVLFATADIGIFHPKILIQHFPWLSFIETREFLHTLILFIFAIELSKGTVSLYRIRFNPSLLCAGSFFFFIIIGAGLLMLPRATHKPLDFIDALFTSTSAVCVTGLIVVDTATHFTRAGQTIIMLLFQIGGLGVMIFTSFFGFFFQGSPTFQNQFFLKDIVNEMQMSKILRTLIKILGFTILVELLGSILIFVFQSQPHFSFGQNVWYAIFHSVSAFCNAGFSVFTNGLNDVAGGTFHNYNLHLVIAILIVFGGIGFPVILNYYSWLKQKIKNTFRTVVRGYKGKNIHHLINLNTRIITNTTLILIVSGTIGFWLLENQNSLAGMSLYGKFVTSFFGAVTPRTAGFNTINTSTMLVPTTIFTIFLMWIGASPSSCGGGIKTSTFALAVLNITSISRGKDRLDIYKRNIKDRNIRRAFAIIILSILVINLAIFLLSITDGHLGMKNIVFECYSAFSTVGLSLGITEQLSNSGKIILICLMFAGRIGTLTIVIAFFRKLSSYQFQYPQEQIYIN
jgi:potassium uptake TrkH family protein